VYVAWQVLSRLNYIEPTSRRHIKSLSSRSSSSIKCR